MYKQLELFGFVYLNWMRMRSWSVEAEERRSYPGVWCCRSIQEVVAGTQDVL